MPELGPYGSVRGALSNGCLYRDWIVTPSNFSGDVGRRPRLSFR